MPMNDVPTIRDALERSYDSVGSLCAELSDAQWQTQSLCPDWTVRDVVIHLAGVERVLTGWLPDDADTPPPFAKAGAFSKETAELEPDPFIRRVNDVFDERRHDLDRLSKADFERPSWTPVGPGTYGRFLAIRVFDFWVHERDITMPLGKTTDDTGICAEIALAEVEGALGYIVGKKVGLPDGRSVTFHLLGPLERDISVVVDGRAKVVEHVGYPDVEVRTDSVTFIQLACGRVDPQVPIDAGKLSWTGDPALGERVAKNLRYTM